jgi:coatomer protein complex subunit epsilon
MALCVNIYLAMNRVDLAEKQIKAMQETDDDDTLTQLSLAWYYVAVGGDKIQEAYLILQEQVEKFGPSIQV